MGKGPGPLRHTAGGGWQWHLCLFEHTDAHHLPPRAPSLITWKWVSSTNPESAEPGTCLHTYRALTLPRISVTGFFQHLVQGAAYPGTAQGEVSCSELLLQPGLGHQSSRLGTNHFPGSW